MQGRIRLLIAFELEKAESLIVAHALVVGLFCNHADIVVHSAFIVFVVDATDGAESIDIRNEGVAFDAEVAILFCSHEVFERELGVGSIIIRCSEKRLCVNGVVEVANGCNVVVRTEGISAHSDGCISIHLCPPLKEEKRTSNPQKQTLQPALVH